MGGDLSKGVFKLDAGGNTLTRQYGLTNLNINALVVCGSDLYAGSSSARSQLANASARDHLGRRDGGTRTLRRALRFRRRQ